MPLVRIALRKGHPPGFGRKVGAIVHQAMIDTINVPPKDVFQIITEHDAEGLIYDPTYLDIQRSDGIVLIQIAMSEGRTDVAKQALYKEVAERLRDQAGLRAEDVFINLVEVKKANWSFGNGIAQYIV